MDGFKPETNYTFSLRMMRSIVSNVNYHHLRLSEDLSNVYVKELEGLQCDCEQEHYSQGHILCKKWLAHFLM